MESSPIWGRCLKRWLRSAEAYELIGDEFDTWLSGGCLPLGQALLKLIGPAAELRAIASNNHPHEHIVVLWQGLYYDGDGASKPTTLIRRWRDQELLKRPRVVLYDPLYAEGLYQNEAFVDRLHQALVARVGPPPK
jgi:hypothetical protein